MLKAALILNSVFSSFVQIAYPNPTLSKEKMQHELSGVREQKMALNAAYEDLDFRKELLKNRSTVLKIQVSMVK